MRIYKGTPPMINKNAPLLRGVYNKKREVFVPLLVKRVMLLQAGYNKLSKLYVNPNQRYII